MCPACPPEGSSCVLCTVDVVVVVVVKLLSDCMEGDSLAGGVALVNASSENGQSVQNSVISIVTSVL